MNEETSLEGLNNRKSSMEAAIREEDKGMYAFWA